MSEAAWVSGRKTSTGPLSEGALCPVCSQARATRGPWQSVASTRQTFQRTSTLHNPSEPWGQDSSALGGLPSQPQPQREKNTCCLLGQPAPKNRRGTCAGKEMSLSFSFGLSILLAGFIIMSMDHKSATIIHTVGDTPLELTTLILHFFKF